MLKVAFLAAINEETLIQGPNRNMDASQNQPNSAEILLVMHVSE